METRLYYFKTKITRVKDADTFVTGDINLGFNMCMKPETIRLYGVDAFETRRRKSTTIKMKKMFGDINYVAKGKEATLFTIDLIQDKDVIIHSREFRGNFGRIFADELYKSGKTWKDLGKTLIKKGYAWSI